MKCIVVSMKSIALSTKGILILSEAKDLLFSRPNPSQGRGRTNNPGCPVLTPLGRAIAALLFAFTATALQAQTTPPPSTTPPPAPGLPAPAPVPNAQLPITLQQATDTALAKNPTLLAARENLRSVRAQEIQAAVRTNPYLALNGADLTEPQYYNNPYAATVGVGRLFERGQKRRWRVDSAQATSVQTEDQLHLTEQQTIFAVRQAFTNFLVAKAAKALADDNLADFRRELTIANDRYTAGDIAKLDFERLDLQLAQFETDESTAITNAQQASDQLQVLLGTEHPSPTFDIAGDVVPPAIARSMDDLEQAALAARPDLQAAQAAVRVAQAQLHLAYANGTADPTAEIDYNRTGTENSVGFVFNIPIRIFDRNQGNKDTARYTVQANQFSVVALHNQVISDVDQAFSGYINAKMLSDRYNGHYLAEAKDILDIARFSYDHGGLALIDYLDALRESRASTAAALNAYQQTWLAIHQLGFVTTTSLTP
jgi:cobalt-zinc-cadmium efflux system outer membrane protein